MPCECKYCEFVFKVDLGDDPYWVGLETKDPEYAWSRTWVIINTAATIGGSVTGLVALVIAVIALTS